MIEIDPGSWFFSWLEDKKEKNDAIADYLDEIAREASNLAMIWQGVAEKIMSYESTSIEDDEKWRDLISKPQQFVNGMVYSRLDELFRTTSGVLGKNHNKTMEPIMFHLGSMLKERHLTKEYVEEALSRIKKATFFDVETKIENIQTIEQSVLTLHKESAALNAYAKSFRATN